MKALGEDGIAPFSTPTPLTQLNKGRRDILDPVIDEAIRQAGNMELADVYLKLKEMALASQPPFTGEIKGDSFWYTNTNDTPKQFTKDALGKRLKRMTNSSQ